MKLMKFLIVGGLGTLVNTGILIVLYHHLHVTLVVASAVATESAICHNFVLNDMWTFGRRRLSLSRFARFNVVSLGGQCITIATLWALVRYTQVHYIAANLVGVGLAVLWNFAVNVHWTWGTKSRSEPTRTGYEG
jgi:putative flippase GtrA